MSCWSTWLCPTLSYFQVYQQKHLRNHDMPSRRTPLGSYESDPLPDLELQCSKLLESEDPDEELWAVHVPPKAPGAISWIYIMRWKMENGQKDTESGLWWLGMFVLFFDFDLSCGAVFRSKKFHVPGTKSKPFKNLNLSCSHVRWQTLDDSIHCFTILQATNLSLFPRYVFEMIFLFPKIC